MAAVVFARSLTTFSQQTWFFGVLASLWIVDFCDPVITFSKTMVEQKLSGSNGNRLLSAVWFTNARHMTHLFSGSFRDRAFGIYGFLGCVNVGAWIWAFLAFHDKPV